MLEFINISLTYQEEIILEDINFSVDKGKIVVLTGNSGSGKSSILKLINGIIPEFYEAKIEGEIKFDGKNIREESMAKRSKYISTIFQNPKTQFYCINTRDELAFGLENRAVSPNMINEIIEKYSKDYQIKDLMDRNIFHLSGGEKQKIAITACSCLDNDIYLFDEPSSSLDEEGLEWLKGILLELKSKNKLVIIAEHRLHYLKNIIDKLYIIKNNKVEEINLNENLNSIEERYQLRKFNIKKDLKNKKKIYLKKAINYIEDEDQLICKDYKLSYSHKDVINTNLSFKEGLTYIIGKNGIGKTSFIKKMLDVIKAKGITCYKSEKIKKNYEYFSLVMQDVNYQIFTDSLWKEISMSSSNVNDKIRVLKELDLYEKKALHPQILSGGEKQRLMLGLAILSSKPIVILDEPTSGLDKKQLLNTAKYLKLMIKQGKYVIVITHDYELINSCEGNVLEFV
ncbi:ABC transporter ATP-binding protein [Sneathia sanguinegens]|uniref:ABC transporter ATP-binding protein n=1 Tax=Sneathia sanguinegens TaxID=40543 RepID=UPI0008331FF4|nr:ABC transporter ATP-binding protein [Sneathia sanguinegens]